jgi:ATP-binding cassette, subfamily B, multidrug efflux pump
MLNWFFTRFEQMIDPFSEIEIKAPPSKILDYYLSYLKQTWPLFLAMMSVGLLATLAEVLAFAYVADIVDILTVTKPQDVWAKHGGSFIMMIFVLGLVWPLLNSLYALISRQGIETNFPALIRWQSHRYVVRQSVSYFANDFAGRVASKIVDTASAVRNSLNIVCELLLYVVVYFISAAVLFLSADIRLIIPLLVWLILYIWVSFIILPKLSKTAEEGSEARSSLVGRVVDSYTNIQTVKLFAKPDHEDAYVRDALRLNTVKWQAQQRLISQIEILIGILSGALMVSTGILCVWLWQTGAITVGAIALVGALTQRILSMSNWVMFQVAGLFESIGTVQNGIATISQSHTLMDIAKAPKLEVTQAEVQFENISFGYEVSEGSRQAISGFQLNITSGEKIGLVGPSGAGKSTLVNLFLRLYDLNSGRILIDGQDISKVTQDSLRAHIGVVTQDTSLLHRSILDNIAYGRPEASDEEVMAAAKRAHAFGFISELRDSQGREGLEAHVGERGVKLSGGQRQRIAIARVLLKDAPILVLDEATSALDSEVEAAIQDSLVDLMQGKTVIAIAHRLSTIARMDRLVVMEAGRIIEQGSHGELIEQNGLYARLWSRQTGGFIA